MAVAEPLQACVCASETAPTNDPFVSQYGVGKDLQPDISVFVQPHAFLHHMLSFSSDLDLRSACQIPCKTLEMA
jgi:hypothetical protein